MEYRIKEIDGMYYICQNHTKNSLKDFKFDISTLILINTPFKTWSEALYAASRLIPRANY